MFFHKRGGLLRLAIIGSGRVGLTTGACFADLGHEVICVDKAQEKINALKSGKIPFFEPGLKELVSANVAEGRLSFTAETSSAVKDRDAVFLCVGTPIGNNGEADVNDLLHSAKQTVENINQYTVVVEKSTAPAGTAEAMKLLAREHDQGKDYDVAVNPEFLRESTAINDFLNPDRIVIGTNSKRADSILTDLYKPLNAPVLHTDMTTAELIKHASNAFLATKISYANMIADLAEKVNADALQALKGIGMDKRIGEAFLQPGIGYGGYCFPKDVAAFIALHKKHGVNCELLESVARINDERKKLFVEKTEQALGGLKGRTLGVLGLSFKPNTDDMRLAPSIEIIRLLQEKGAVVKAYDPQAMNNAKKIPELSSVEFCENAYHALENAEALLLLTEWDEFAGLDLSKIRSVMKNPVVVDGRNVYRPDRMRQLGFKYEGIGRNGNPAINGT